MKLGANSVLFGAFDMATAFRCVKMAGYDGIELSAIGGMSEHLVLDRWQECAPEIKKLATEYELELLAMEQPSQDLALELPQPLLRRAKRFGRRGALGVEGGQTAAVVFEVVHRTP